MFVKFTKYLVGFTDPDPTPSYFKPIWKLLFKKTTENIDASKFSVQIKQMSTLAGPWTLRPK